MEEQLEKLKVVFESVKKLLLDVWGTFVSAMKSVPELLVNTYSSFVEEYKKASAKYEEKSKPFDELRMYPPIIETQIAPFVFDERCEKCHRKGTHPRRYIAKVSLLLTSCHWCGAIWWQRPADYIPMEQFRFTGIGKIEKKKDDDNA